MKDKIIEILALIPLDNRLRWKERWANHNKAHEELTQLMCYREVRQIILHRTVHATTDLQAIIISTLEADYPLQVILNAIEQVKNGQK